jgi:hypothetical protein
MAGKACVDIAKKRINLCEADSHADTSCFSGEAWLLPYGMRAQTVLRPYRAGITL